MRTALERLNDELEESWGVRLTSRIGVNTGEVVSGDPTEGEHLVVGDAVNVAAGLEQAAGGMEILIGPADPSPRARGGRGRAGRAARAEGARPSVFPRTGSSASPAPTEPPGGSAAPLVGRDRSCSAPAGACSRALDERHCRLVTVLGDAGVGKSRLLAALEDSLEQDELVLPRPVPRVRARNHLLAPARGDAAGGCHLRRRHA